MKPKILIVDDELVNLNLLRATLENEGYKLFFAKSGENALQQVTTHNPDLILLDIMMPGLSGYDVCIRLKSNEKTKNIPIIFVTTRNTEINEADGFALGAVDYITKPISQPIVRARVKTHLSLVQVEKLESSRLLIIQRLGRAAEYRDNETGLHVIRMSHYSRILAQALGQPDDWCEMLLNAAPMHDVGKIGTPDHILLKPGKLDDDEWKIMRQHPGTGAGIIGKHDSPLLEMSRLAALTHHEKWDGTGYPRGLAGEEIPLEGRIIAIGDVFDALTTARPYKKAWSIEKAINLLKKESGKHFDPNLVPIFLREDIFRQVLDVREKWAEKI